jgi:hypothetical protein
MKLAAEPNPTQGAAINYLLCNRDDAPFAKSFIPAGQKLASNDEFSERAGAGGARQVSEAALAYAHRILNGDGDFPVTVTLKLRRFNPANETFLTDAVEPDLNLSVTVREQGDMPRGAQDAALRALAISNWNFFSGLQIPAPMAKRLAEIVGTRREISLAMNCRLVPNTTQKERLRETFLCSVGAIVRSFSILSVDPKNPIPDDIARAIKFTPYGRTAADGEFEAKVLNRTLVSAADTLVFIADGRVLHGDSLDKAHSPEAKVRKAATMTAGNWYVIGGNLFLQAGHYNDQLVAFEFEGRDTLRLDGVPFQDEKRVQFDGRRFSWVE